MNANTWTSDDPKDRFWQLVRLAMEEANLRYCLPIYANVHHNHNMLTAYLTTHDNQGGFCFSITEMRTISAPPIFLLELHIYPLLKNLAIKRDMKHPAEDKPWNII